MTQFWLVGQTRANTEQGDIWDFQGLFATEGEAVASCRSSAYWVGPVNLGEALPDVVSEWPGAYFPHERAAIAAAGEGEQRCTV